MTKPEIKYTLHDSTLVAVSTGPRREVVFTIDLYPIFYPTRPRIRLRFGGIKNFDTVKRYVDEIRERHVGNGIDNFYMKKKSDGYWFFLDIDWFGLLRIHCSRMTMIEVESFEWEVMNHLPSPQSLRHFYYPGASTVGGRDGVIVRMEPNDDAPWIGTFAFGQFGSRGVTKVVPLPDRQRLCVVSRGAGYVVLASDPLTWEEIPFVPILDVREISQAGLVVFANQTELFAYGKHGYEWRTKRLAWDGLWITKVSNRSIRGEYWDIRNEETRTFEVDLTTGASTGGVEDSS